MRRTTGAALVAAGAIVVAGWPAAAVADQTYKTQKYPLTAVGDAPQARGFVLNAHANGPVVYGQERYHLAGAAPNADYDVVLEIFGDPECAVATGLVFPTATVTTNRVGNGQARATFLARDVAPLIPVPTTVYGVWTLSTDGAVAYTTGCQPVQLDVPPPPPPGRARR
jgi:hypothetical protein